jgi:small subunit ribosomal protein S16
MATKIRLARHGHKDYAYYHIVVADSRSPRDGKFIERIGSYNPNTNPATIDLNFERALYWVNVGAQPTDTVRNILSREGVMLMKHLQGGVKKGAFDEATAQKRFDAWKAEKDAKLGKVSAEEAAKAPAILTGKPKVLIPAFPGTNCEYDSARAMAAAGAQPQIMVIRNMTAEAIRRLAEAG